MRYVINYSGGDQALASELRQISASIDELNNWEIPVFFQEPEKPQRGQIIYADATGWNPGEGTGVYTYDGTSWNKIGTAAGGGATQLLELSDVASVTYTNREVLVSNGSVYSSRLLTEADISDLGSYVAEAPEDGEFYVRSNGAWVVTPREAIDSAYAYFMAD